MSGILGVSIVEVHQNGHIFGTSNSCANCGIGRGAYENHKPPCRDYMDANVRGYQLVDKYLAAGKDPEMMIVSKKEIRELQAKVNNLLTKLKKFSSIKESIN